MSASPDWGVGAYELFAPDLLPAAEYMIELAEPQPGERAVDLGCGSGNATLALAATGAQVTAVDPSLRLLGIAARRLREEGYTITTSLATAEAIPLPEADADLVISNFGVIFSADPPSAISEVLRILRRDGRFLFTTWLPEGPIGEVAKLMREETLALAPGLVRTDDDAVAGQTPQVVWHEPESYAHLVPGGTDRIAVRHGVTSFAADSAEAWVERQEENHPMWIAARSIIDDARWQAIRERAVEILAAASADDDGFVVKSPYAVVEIRPQG